MSRPVWRHFALLLFLVAAFAVEGSASTFHRLAPTIGWGTAFQAGLLSALGARSFITYSLGLVAAIAVGAVSWGRQGFRNAITVLVVTMGAMVCMDTIVSPAAARGERNAAIAAKNWPRYFGDTAIRARSDTLGYIRTGLQLVREQPAELHQPLGTSWSQDNARDLAVESVVNVAQLLLPFTLIGITLGIMAWIRRYVTFKTLRAEVVARWFIALTCAPFVWAFVTSWSRGMAYGALHDQAFLRPLEPYIPFVILAVLGWRSASKDASVANASNA